MKLHPFVGSVRRWYARCFGPWWARALAGGLTLALWYWLFTWLITPAHGQIISPVQGPLPPGGTPTPYRIYTGYAAPANATIASIKVLINGYPATSGFALYLGDNTYPCQRVGLGFNCVPGHVYQLALVDTGKAALKDFSLVVTWSTRVKL